MMLSMLEYAPDPVQDMCVPDGYRNSGWVYVLSNPSMPDIYKIGMTTTDPQIRAKEISQGTGVPSPFTVVRAYFSENPREDEIVIHEELSAYRFNPNREFFRCPLSVIDECIESSTLFQKTDSVSKIADSYSVISFEHSCRLHIDELFEALGLSVFGDRLAIAERLIEMSIKTVRKLNGKGISLVFSEGVATPVVQDSHRRYEEFTLRQAKIQAETGIYGPQLPPDTSDIPF